MSDEKDNNSNNEEEEEEEEEDNDSHTLATSWASGALIPTSLHQDKNELMLSLAWNDPVTCSSA